MPCLRLVLGSVAVLGASFVAFGSSAFADEAASAPKAPVVAVETVAESELADEISYPARVVSLVNASVNAELDGIVVATTVPLGASVKAGATLLTLKNTDPVYEYVPVRVTSPVTGVVSALIVAPGTMVKRGDQLATVTDPSQIRVRVEIAAADLSRIKTNLDGSFTNGPSATEVIPVRVVGVSPLVDPATGTATAELVAVDAKGQKVKTDKTAALPIGLVGRVGFKVNRRQGLQVLEQALVYRGEEVFVRVVDNATAKFVPVKVAATRRGLSEISSGLKVGDVVIVRASGFVADGQAVTVQESDVATK